MNFSKLKNLFNKAKEDFSYNHKEYFDRLNDLLEYKIKDGYETIFVLATDIKKENGKIVFKERDDHGALDDYFRLDAIIKLINEGKVEKVLLVGGCNKDIGKFRTEAMKDYVKTKLKLNEGLENKLSELRCCPGNTCGNIVEIVNYLNRERAEGEKIGVLTNIYHIPRIEELIKDCKESYLNDIEFIPAETVLNTEEKEIMERIINFYSQKETKKRFSSEINGIRSIKRGKYTCKKYLALIT